MLGKDNLQVQALASFMARAQTIIPVCTQASFMARAQTMSSHCSGCGSSELALRCLRAAWAAVGFNLTMQAISSCALDSGCQVMFYTHCHGHCFQTGLPIYDMWCVACLVAAFYSIMCM